jgi:hypothetical protein
MTNAEYLQKLENAVRADREAAHAAIRRDLGLPADAAIDHKTYLEWRAKGGIARFGQKPAVASRAPLTEADLAERRAYESLIRNTLGLAADAPVDRACYLRFREKLGLGRK